VVLRHFLKCNVTSYLSAFDTCSYSDVMTSRSFVAFLLGWHVRECLKKNQNLVGKLRLKSSFRLCCPVEFFISFLLFWFVQHLGLRGSGV
jgi:hypothetical protein